ncbi:MAG: protein kinase [Calditrichia bacterium]
MIGKTISHYKILEELGAGGMGVVYKAKDTKLNRFVALKFLLSDLTRDEEAKNRFISEAQAASALDHPNICTIYEINETDDGQMFIAMACYEGESLKEKLESGPLPIDTALDIASQIARGLEKAHDKGIVHRDIKPANIFVTGDGQVKIIDFGLAKLSGRTLLTKTGSTLGTVAYMSPEQTRGEKIDHRTDIWSAGIVLYEMLTGQLPFRGEYDQAIIYSIMNEAHAPITGFRTGVSLELVRIVNKMLEKNPDDRYQSMSELLLDLKGISQGNKSNMSEKSASLLNLSQIKRSYVFIPLIAVFVTIIFYFGYLSTEEKSIIGSIAVLPLENLSGIADQEYFVDGMTDALIAELAQISSIRVISRTSAMQYKNVRKPIHEIAEELNVDALVEGSVLYDDKQVRITVQLIQANPEQHLWAHNYRRDLHNIFELQEEVVQGIAQEINITLTPDEQLRLNSAKFVDPEVYRIYLKGYYNADKSTFDGLNRSIEYYNEALRKDPNFALGYVGLAEAYLYIGMWTGFPEEAKSKFRTAAKRAIEIDSTFNEIHRLQAMLKIWNDWDPLGAEKDLKKALKLNPNSAVARDLYSSVLTMLGRFDEAIAERDKAIELDPLSHQVNCNGCYTYFAAKQYDKAIEHSKHTTEQFGSACSFEDLIIGWAYIEKDMYDEALSVLEKRQKISKNNDRIIAAIAESYALKGQQDKAKHTMAELNALSVRRQGHPSYYLSAVIYAALGNPDEAFGQLQKAYDTKDWQFPWLKVDQRLASLRSDQRFEKMTQLLKF